MFRVSRTSDTLTQATQLRLIRPQLVPWQLNHGSALFIQSHLEAFSAASVLLQMALLLLSPVMPSAVYALQRDCPAKPLHPTSTGKHLAFQPCSWQLLTKSWYFPFFRSKASSIRSSHGTVSSSMTTFFVASDTRMMSGLSEVLTICWGNLSCLPRSTDSC